MNETFEPIEEKREQEEVRPFWGFQEYPSTYSLQKEQPHHRAICIQLAQGYTTMEVAAMTGFSMVTVNYVKKQPWAQKYIAEMMERAGRKAVMNELHGGALAAAQLIVKSVKGELEDQKTSDRCKDAHKLLDRLFGSAPQTVLHGTIDPNDLSDEELATIATGTNT
jgi:branched-subunit amino acid permease